MKTKKSLNLVTLFLLVSIILVSCGGSPALPLRGGQLAATEAPAATEAAAYTEETITVTPPTEGPVVTEERTTATEEPIPTEGMAITEELIVTQTPVIAKQLPASEEPTGTEEPTVEEPTATELPTAESPTFIYPAEGFWAVNGPDAQVATVSPVDWLETDAYGSPFEEFSNEGMDVLGLASPDNKAFIYFMVYHDHLISDWSQPLAQERALRILNKMYAKNAGDIKVVSVRLMPDGSERLAWSSKACGCSGMLAYNAGPPKHGTVVTTKNLWFFNAFTINSYENTYAAVFDYAFELLTFPPEESHLVP